MNPHPAFPVPVIGFAARSGTGKTTLLRRLIPLLVEQGLRIAVVKHSHHDFDIDKPGKDSYELHHAGASQTLLSSRYRSALIQENLDRIEPRLSTELTRLDTDAIDLVLVEGFRDDPSLRKIELLRPALGKEPLYLNDPSIIAIACNEPLQCSLPVFPLDHPEVISRFIIETIAAC